jgi:hypothetical protein
MVMVAASSIRVLFSIMMIEGTGSVEVMTILGLLSYPKTFTKLSNNRLKASGATASLI